MANVHGRNTTYNNQNVNNDIKSNKFEFVKEPKRNVAKSALKSQGTESNSPKNETIKKHDKTNKKKNLHVKIPRANAQSGKQPTRDQDKSNDSTRLETSMRSRSEETLNSEHFFIPFTSHRRRRHHRKQTSPLRHIHIKYNKYGSTNNCNNNTKERMNNINSSINEELSTSPPSSTSSSTCSTTPDPSSSSTTTSPDVINDICNITVYKTHPEYDDHYNHAENEEPSNNLSIKSSAHNIQNASSSVLYNIYRKKNDINALKDIEKRKRQISLKEDENPDEDNACKDVMKTINSDYEEYAGDGEDEEDEEVDVHEDKLKQQMHSFKKLEDDNNYDKESYQNKDDDSLTDKENKTKFLKLKLSMNY